MNTAMALDLMLALLIQAQKIGAIVTAAQAQGRTDLTPQQWADVLADADAARSRLANAIEAAKS